ncbi:MAG: S-layer homology domain-containing protein [Bryobacteraceae bacterium]
MEFVARAGSFRIFLTGEEVVCAAPGDVSRFQLVGAAPNQHWQGAQKLPGVSSYFIGKDKSKWQAAIPQYGRVERRGVYEGIDFEVGGTDHKIEYRFNVSPHANPNLIRLSFPNATPSISPNGDLVLRSPSGEFRHRAPHAFQNNRRVPVSFRLVSPTEVSFHLPSYDPSLPLLIDPVISYHFFHGGFNSDTAVGAGVDAAGDLYYTGRTNSLDFPVAGSPFRDFNSGNVDIFLARVNSSGSLIFSTYIGGAGNDEAAGIAVDPDGYSSIIATTYSTDLNIDSAAFQSNYGGNGDALALRMTPSGFLPPLMTYLGGSSQEFGTAVALDANGAAYFTGYTSSTNFPTRTPRQASFAGGDDMFIVKIHPGGAVLFSTYFGGEGTEQAYGIATDKDGNPFLTGRAACATIPAGPTIGSLDGNDLVVMKWKSNGDGAQWITCIGGNGTEIGRAIRVDASGNSYVTGNTTSTNFPVAAPVQIAFGGNQNGGPNGDAFALKLNPSGTNLLYSTYLGGSRDDVGQSVFVNSLGEAFFAGVTRSLNFPSTGPLIVPTDRAAYLLRLSSNGLTLLGSWFADGVNDGDRFTVVMDSKSNVFLTGGASSGIRLPVAAAPPILPFKSPQDSLILKLSNSRLQVFQDTFSPSFLNTQDFDLIQRVVNRGPESAEHVTIRGILPNGLLALSCFATGVTCSTTGNSYRVDIPQLTPGAGVEVRTTLRPTANAFPGVAQQINLSALSDTYDSQATDNALTTTLFGADTQPACSYALSNQAFDVPASTTLQTVTVTAPFSCPWSAIIPTDWISFASPSVASGSANISFTIQQNTDTVPRVGSVVVAGHRVVFVQAAAGTPVSPFTDVPTTNPFFSFISLMKTNGITQGCTATTYCPDDLITRGQMAVFLVRSVLGSDSFSNSGTPYFADVPSGHPQFRYIQKLRELGITAGCTTTTYCPGEPVTRAQMAAFLVRGKLAVAPAQAFPFPTAFSFNDVDTNSVFYPSIQKMRELGVTLGCSSSQYCPESPTTRAQMAAFLVRSFFAP